MINNQLFELYVFDVGLGQSIFFRAINHEHYNLMIDVGYIENKHPIDFLISQNVIPIDEEGYYYIGDLTITNYDHDHYSGLPYLMSKAKIKSTSMIKSIHHDLLNANKPEKTDALRHLMHIKQTYTADVLDWNPPYTKWTKYLQPTENWKGDFNNLSQIVFIEYMGFTICIPGDLEQVGRGIMLQDQEIINRLAKTQIFIASHHGRENGYMKEIFDHCKPNLIIISDKEVMHSTQENSASVYGRHVNGTGIVFEGSPRKVISTRSDGSFVFKGFNNLNYSINKILF